MSQPLPLRLGVNVDHVATLRQARGTAYPSPLTAALIAQASGADSITVHLREDRRHIQEGDVVDLLNTLSVPLNLELAAEDAILTLAEEWRPQACCLVPEKREELTTEGGLDVAGGGPRIVDAVGRLRETGARVSLFVEPDLAQLEAIVATGAQAVEIHTGAYAEAREPGRRNALLEGITDFAHRAAEAGLEVHAGHGLTVDNTAPIARIAPVQELNIGHSLIGDAVLIGMAAAGWLSRVCTIRFFMRATAAAPSYSAL